MPLVCNTHHVWLDKLPIIDTESRSRLDWFLSHLFKHVFQEGAQ
jgi:hypothetical protein